MILQQSLPQVDLDDDILLPSDHCPEYLDALYSLRSICGAWRYLVDGNPSLWKVVCSELPMEVNSAVIAKSGQSPLIVHCSDTRPDLVVEFMELANSQRGRWATASFQFSESDSAASYLADPAPQLQSLSLEGDPLAEGTETSISLLGGQTQNIRKLHILFTPIQWSPNPFTGLKSLKLIEVGIQDGGPTIQHILDILACSPALETLTLSRTELIPTAIEAHSPKLRLPLLKILSFISISAITVEQILDRIAVDPDIVTQIDISLKQSISNASHFLTETLPPFIPVFRSLNKHCDGSTLKVFPSGDFFWRSKIKQGHSFRVRVRGIGTQAFLPWLEQAVGTDGVGVGVLLRLDLYAFTGGDMEMLSIFERSRIVTEVDVTFGLNSSCQDAVLEAVSRIEEVADQAGMVAIPSFPSLHTILLENWTGSLDGIEQALRKRFAKRAMMKAHLPDLLVKISCLRVGERVANDSEGILHYDDTHRIRRIDGVRDFRIGDVPDDEESYAGILAVVWCEGSSLVVWG
ncbi:hypothetical protein FRC00_005903 [Tulasnella sp. 408]|nr:hypothetical protein FRC00_005903 [Tulasnella sp. 408]